MTATDAADETDALDVTDLDQHMGVPMEPGELKEPVTTNDIRRWVQAMHYPNPLHYDERWAGESRFGSIVAPQSFTVACDTSHGASPAQVGLIPDSHLIFGGDDWWFFGPQVTPGDKMVCHRMPYDYRVTDTRFAGSTCFQRGDTLYINQRGERVALQRSTAIRYKARQAREKEHFSEPEEPEWTDAELASLEERKLAFIDQIQGLGHDPRSFGSVAVGDRLAENVLGPHSLASFTTEWRAFPMTTWGATAKGPTTVRAEALGYTKEMAGFEGDRRMERVNPELTDGAYYGPSRGHLQPRWARHVGMPRGYGYGASMGAWIIDYVAGWAGEWGRVTHSTAQYRSPAFTGDVTFVSGEVVDTRVERKRRHIAVVAVEVHDQLDNVMAKATVDVELPRGMSNRIILSTAPLRGPGVDQLRELGELVLDPWIDQSPLRLYDGEALAARAAEVGATVLICEADSCKGPVLDLPLEAIGSTRGDPTNVDLPGATAKGIPVLRAPGRNADAVAERTVGLLLAVTRHLLAADRDVREGQVYRDGSIPYQRFRGWQLAGRTAGLVGLGAVGRATAWRLEGLGMRVISSDPFAPDATHELDDLLAEADVVSMHAAVTPDTLGLISAARVGRMKEGAVYVNSARAGLHDLDALTAALASGHLSAAALDHFEGEHLATDHPLVAMSNVILTPHIGGATYDTETNHTTLMAEGLAALLRGEVPANLANPEVLDRG